MKAKALIPIFCSIFIGFLLGKLIFNQYDDNSINTFEEGERIYFVQINKFSSKEEMNNSIDNIDNFLYLNENDTYYVYAGISKKEEIANKVKEYYKKAYNNVIVQQKNVTNESFLNILSEYDKITEITTRDEDLISIEQIILSNYKEMILGAWF